MPPTSWWARLRLGCSAAEAGAGHSSRSTLLSNVRTKCVADRFRVEIDSSFSKAGYTRSRPLGLTGVQPSPATLSRPQARHSYGFDFRFGCECHQEKFARPGTGRL